MASKKELLKNIQSYSPEEIADAIRSGVVTLYELGHDTEGQFTPLLKKQVKDILAKPASPGVETTVTKPQNPVEEKNDKQLSMDAEDSTTTSEENTAVTPFIISPQESENGDGNGEPITNYVESKDKPGMFRNPFSFKGRIRRLEYGISCIIMAIVNIIIQGILSVAENSNGSEGLIVLYFVLLIPYCWFSFAQGAKRCHDRGNSGWYQIIPFYGLWMLFADGDIEANEYGECPK